MSEPRPPSTTSTNNSSNRQRYNGTPKYRGRRREKERGKPPSQPRPSASGTSNPPSASTTGISVSTVDNQSIAHQDKLVASFRSLSLRRERPFRPGYGEAGTPITVLANFLSVKLPSDDFYDYTITVEPKIKRNDDRERLFDLFDNTISNQKWFEDVVHDRSSRLVSKRELPVPLVFQVSLPHEHSGKNLVYEFSISFLRTLSMTEFKEYLQGTTSTEGKVYDPLPIISALNLDIQDKASHSGIRIGRRTKVDENPEKEKDSRNDGKARHFFRNLKGNPIPLTYGLEILRGLFTSVRPTVDGLMLNVNTCTMAFYEPGNMADKLANSQRGAGGIPTSLPDPLSSGIQITTTHLGYKRRKPLRNISHMTARQHKFHCEELGNVVSVEEFFKQKYDITLKHADDLPLLDLGTAQKPNLVPAELCEIEPGVPYMRTLNKFATSKMIGAARKTPEENKGFIINNALPNFGLTERTKLGLQVSLEMTVIPARELDPPTLVYKGNSKPQVKAASWNLIGKKFDEGAKVESWWALAVDCDFKGEDDARLTNVLNKFSTSMMQSGLQVTTNATSPSVKLLIQLSTGGKGQPRHTVNPTVKIRTAINAKLSEHAKPSFILVLLPKYDTTIYSAIKRLGDVELGIHTVHILMDNKFLNAQYFGNVMLKVNAKLGGVNHRLDDEAMKWLKEEKTMMVGIDVSHPTGGGGMDGAPSVAAVVASVDHKFAQFPASLRIQRGRQEMLHELRGMLIERLQLYQSRNECLPNRLFVFRDGVSEGQYNIVLGEELEQMREAFKELYKDESGYPKLSIMVCSKRHHARFYPTDSSRATNNGNTRPGTVVDRGVTSAYDFDFYLQPHAGLQGTVRPTHYIVIYDENALTADTIQQGTHAASYLYARATKAVSLVPPAYYADIACERGRCYVSEFFSGSGGNKGGKGGQGKAKGKGQNMDEKEAVFRRAQERWGEGVHKDLRDSMFYL